jgi:hypothetical protein
VAVSLGGSERVYVVVVDSAPGDTVEKMRKWVVAEDGTRVKVVAPGAECWAGGPRLGGGGCLFWDQAWMSAVDTQWAWAAMNSAAVRDIMATRSNVTVVGIGVLPSGVLVLRVGVNARGFVCHKEHPLPRCVSIKVLGCPLRVLPVMVMQGMVQLHVGDEHLGTCPVLRSGCALGTSSSPPSSLAMSTATAASLGVIVKLTQDGDSTTRWVGLSTGHGPWSVGDSVWHSTPSALKRRFLNARSAARLNFDFNENMCGPEFFPDFETWLPSQPRMRSIGAVIAKAVGNVHVPLTGAEDQHLGADVCVIQLTEEEVKGLVGLAPPGMHDRGSRLRSGLPSVPSVLTGLGPGNCVSVDDLQRWDTMQVFMKGAGADETDATVGLVGTVGTDRRSGMVYSVVSRHHPPWLVRYPDGTAMTLIPSFGALFGMPSGVRGDSGAAVFCCQSEAESAADSAAPKFVGLHCGVAALDNSVVGLISSAPAIARYVQSTLHP